jgi:hypothetical protein
MHRAIGWCVYVVCCEQEIRVARRGSPSVECEGDFGWDVLQVIANHFLCDVSTPKDLCPKCMVVRNVPLGNRRPAELQQLVKAAPLH